MASIIRNNNNANNDNGNGIQLLPIQGNILVEPWAAGMSNYGTVFWGFNSALKQFIICIKDDLNYIKNNDGDLPKSLCITRWSNLILKTNILGIKLMYVMSKVDNF